MIQIGLYPDESSTSGREHLVPKCSKTTASPKALTIATKRCARFIEEYTSKRVCVFENS